MATAGVASGGGLLGPKTKIVATVGPASESADVLERLARAGVDVFRLNLAHGDWEWHSTVIRRIRAVEAALGKPLAILQDRAGPKLRLGELPGGVRACAVGERLFFVKEPTGDPNELTTSYPGLVDDLREGDPVLLADGTVGLRITGKRPGVAEAQVTLAGEIRSRQGINLPGVRLQLDSLTEKDLRDLDQVAAHDIDYLGQSFVRRPEDIDRLRAELRRRGCAAGVVAKIEKAEALEALDGIIARADAVMVARGDLGVEIDVARVPMVQKQIIRQCNRLGVRMLESMRASARPTRAEASDVANAILDGTDAVMLSAETASGQYPVQAVEIMTRIAQETERAAPELFADRPLTGPAPPAAAGLTGAGHGLLAITRAAVEAGGRLADHVRARLVVAATHGGHTALALSKQRNLTPTLGLSDQPATLRRMALYWGVLPVRFDVPHVHDEYVNHVTTWARQHGLVQPGDRMVFVFGLRWAAASYNTVLVHEVR